MQFPKFCSSKEYTRSLQGLLLHNKRLSIQIGPSKLWLVLCCTLQICVFSYGLKSSTLHVIFSTEFLFTLVRLGKCMKFEGGESWMSNPFIFFWHLCYILTDWKLIQNVNLSQLLFKAHNWNCWCIYVSIVCVQLALVVL